MVTRADRGKRPARSLDAGRAAVGRRDPETNDDPEDRRRRLASLRPAPCRARDGPRASPHATTRRRRTASRLFDTGARPERIAGAGTDTGVSPSATGDPARKNRTRVRIGTDRDVAGARAVRDRGRMRCCTPGTGAIRAVMPGRSGCWSACERRNWLIARGARQMYDKLRLGRTCRWMWVDRSCGADLRGSYAAMTRVGECLRRRRHPPGLSTGAGNCRTETGILPRRRRPCPRPVSPGRFPSCGTGYGRARPRLCPVAGLSSRAIWRAGGRGAPGRLRQWRLAGADDRPCGHRGGASGLKWCGALSMPVGSRAPGARRRGRGAASTAWWLPAVHRMARCGIGAIVDRCFLSSIAPCGEAPFGGGGPRGMAQAFRADWLVGACGPRYHRRGIRTTFASHGRRLPQNSLRATGHAAR